MKIALWVVQVLLAVAMLMAGAMKTFQPLDVLAAEMAWAADAPAWVVRLAGISEVLGAIGLILPAATRIKPILTPIAASSLGVVMLLAAGLHLARGETAAVVAPLILLALAVFVAYGRFKLAPIAERSQAPAAPA